MKARNSTRRGTWAPKLVLQREELEVQDFCDPLAESERYLHRKAAIDQAYNKASIELYREVASGSQSEYGQVYT